MRKTTLQFFLFALFLVAFCFVHPVFAHGGEPRLEINRERLSPGAPLEIRGVDFDSEQEVTLTLVGSQTETILAKVVCDIEGGFLLTVALPVDLAEGQYVVHAKTDDHEIDSPQFTVWGTAVVDNSGNDQSQEDVMLAPMPTISSPAIDPTPLPSSGKPDPDPPGVSQPLTFLAGLIVLVAVIYVARRNVKRR